VYIGRTIQHHSKCTISWADLESGRRQNILKSPVSEVRKLIEQYQREQIEKEKNNKM